MLVFVLFVCVCGGWLPVSLTLNMGTPAMISGNICVMWICRMQRFEFIDTFPNWKTIVLIQFMNDIYFWYWWMQLANIVFRSQRTMKTIKFEVILHFWCLLVVTSIQLKSKDRLSIDIDASPCVIICTNYQLATVTSGHYNISSGNFFRKWMIWYFYGFSYGYGYRIHTVRLISPCVGKSSMCDIVTHMTKWTQSDNAIALIVFFFFFCLVDVQYVDFMSGNVRRRPSIWK